jgi:hypothetical protein
VPATELPGYRVVQDARPTEDVGLRNDVAAFLGPTDRGPLGVPVRVASRLDYASLFGRQRAGMGTPRAVAAFFANDGEVAWVVRTGRDGTSASASVELGTVAGGAWDAGGPARLSLPGNELVVTASSPGTWADGTVVTLTYRAYGVTGEAELDLRIAIPGEPVVQRTSLGSDELLDAVASSGSLIAAFAGPPVTGQVAGPSAGPASLRWTLRLADGAEPTTAAADYLRAVAEQTEIDEIALVCAPDLEGLGPPAHDDVLAALAGSAAARLDRLVVLAVDGPAAREVDSWRRRLAAALPDARERRAVAAYWPWLLAENLAGTGVERYLPTSPVGHVCGAIARRDRERGSGWSPANVLVNDAVDVATTAGESDQALAVGGGLNLLRCRPGGGLEIWGSRTLDAGDGRHVAHRRLVHRVVRAIRRVAEPLVFDTNGPVMWFMFTRAISSVLLEAFRAGALQGETPDQAYRVRCDETVNTQDLVDAGLVVCEIELAPAVPMEFITLRLTLGAQGLMEVVEQ